MMMWGIVMMNKGYYAILLKNLLAKREKNRRYNRRYIQHWILIFMRNYFCMIYFARILPLAVTWLYYPDLISIQQDYFLYNLVILLPLCFPAVLLVYTMFYLFKCMLNGGICEFKLFQVIHSLIPLFITIQVTQIKFDGYTTNYSAIIFERQWLLAALIYVCVYCMFRSIIGAPSRYVGIEEDIIYIGSDEENER